MSDGALTTGLSFRYRFEAAHRFTKSTDTDCTTPHGHTWYARLELTAPGFALNSQDMVTEFQKIKYKWKMFITKTADHSFLHHVEDPILPALREFVPNLRSLPFPSDPTTEMIAGLFFAKAWAMHINLVKQMNLMQKPECPRPSAMWIRETPTNQIVFRAGQLLDLHSPLEIQPGFEWLARLQHEWRGWWQDPDPEARHLAPRTGCV